MKHLSGSLKNLVALLMFGVLMVVLVFVFQAQQGQSGSGLSQPNQPCVPTPQLYQAPGEPTPTPLPSQYGTSPLVGAPGVTPLPISKTTDLAAGLTDRDKIHVYVRRCNGTYELFLLAPVQKEIPISNRIPLGPGDTFFAVPPESIMGVQAPPRRTPTFAAPIPMVSPLTIPTDVSNTLSVSPLPTPTRSGN